MLDDSKRQYCHDRIYYGLSRKEAGLRAGASTANPVRTVRRWEQDPEVEAYMESLRQDVRENAATEIPTVTSELTKILVADPVRAYDERGRLKQMNKIPDMLRRAISSIETREVKSACPHCNKPIQAEVRKVKFWSKTEASKQLLMHLGGFAENNKQLSDSLSSLIAKTAETKRPVIEARLVDQGSDDDEPGDNGELPQ